MISVYKKLDENPFTYEFVKEFAIICCKLWTVELTFCSPLSVRIVPTVIPGHPVLVDFLPSNNSTIPIATILHGDFTTSVSLPTIYKEVPIENSAEKIIVLLQLLSKIKTLPSPEFFTK